MSVNTNIITSTLANGFKNYNSADFFVNYAGGSIAFNTYAGPIRATTPLNNTNAVAEVQVQYSGLETFWRSVPGVIITNYPNNATLTYQIQTFTYFSGGNLVVDTYIINQTGSAVAPAAVSIPALTIYCSAKLYNAPF